MKRFIVMLVAYVLTLALCGCGVMDFGDKSDSQWEFDSFLLHVGPQGADPDGDGYDDDGNKIVSPEVANTYAFPDIHAGYAWLDGEDPRLTPTINVELCETKVPYIRWLSWQLGAGTDEVHVYMGKRLTSIYEITIGPMLAWRFDEHDTVFGIQGTLIKF